MVFDSILNFVGIFITLVSVILAVKYRRKINLISWIEFAVSLAILGVALFTIGLATGLFIIFMIISFAFIGYGIQLYIKWESIFVDIAFHCGIKKEEARAITQDVYRSSKASRAVGLINASKAIQKLANRNRTVNEIKRMTPHILTFSVAHRIDVVKAADDIDTILRRFGYDASETQRVVDVLTAADLKSAATVEELIESIKIYSNGNKKRS
ncbi:phage tail tape measure protein [ANME-1 cluster archaeon AG-394-G06]|nr:phage tail tape measure protein [ANME-1 cluster archaeon AG-394-G06]